MHAVFERAAVLDQVQPEARPLALAADGRVGQPDLRDEVEAGEIGQHAAVDPVGLQASGAMPRALTASAILTSQPASSSWSCTKRAPVIDSITASTDVSPRRRPSSASASRSGGTAPIPTCAPSRSRACQSRRLRLRSNPTYNMRWASLRLIEDARSFTPREALLHQIQSATYVRYAACLRPCSATSPIAPGSTNVIV